MYKLRTFRRIQTITTFERKHWPLGIDLRPGLACLSLVQGGTTPSDDGCSSEWHGQDLQGEAGLLRVCGHVDVDTNGLNSTSGLKVFRAVNCSMSRSNCPSPSPPLISLHGPDGAGRVDSASEPLLDGWGEGPALNSHSLGLRWSQGQGFRFKQVQTGGLKGSPRSARFGASCERCLASARTEAAL